VSPAVIGASPPAPALRHRDPPCTRQRAGPVQRDAGTRLTKIVINMGVGRATQQQSLLEGAVGDLQLIAGQRPVITKARRSIAAFKLARACRSAAW